jgi:oligo-1,6-glucosidase
MFDFEEDIFGNSDKGWYDRTPCLPEDYKECVFRAQSRAAGIGFLSNIIENHDESRGVSRYIPKEELSETSKKALACAYFLLRGIPFIYQGQEIGMENKVVRSLEELDDVSSISEYGIALDAGCTKEEALAAVSQFSRDNARTPMQWSAGENAGFTAGTPWLKVNPNHRTINAASQLGDPDSVFSCYQRLIALRRADPVFLDGRFALLEKDHPAVFAYTRTNADTQLLVLCNFYGDTVENPLPCEDGAWELLIASYPTVTAPNTLRPYEGRMYRRSLR